ncbi:MULTISPECIES: HK97 family phage prohead protease [Actinomycetes]|uniref:Phage prohead protease, HK97 family n=2 Tax=Alloscardovia omnicolens TaxID=419015 RepID=U1R6W6_9BIFI|nr:MULTISPECIES: HK97 family phage prohead protease [Actinomycetes]ERH29746.1 phage prohead protease, HK97 family [Alloscardovia omnicolens F0580]MBS6347092.1 HK97 family phage prohead protease [Alloscardovia omnicolens]MDK6522713.1 HK97 family phage prohead protease [Alloscardovia omnicolens]
MTLYKSFHVKAEDAGEGIIEGYASTWDKEPDSYGDIVAKGAFTRTLKERGDNPIPFLFGHRTDTPEMNLGAATAVEDDKGLKFTAKLDLDNPNAAYTYKLFKEGRINQFSFAYAVRDAGEVELDEGVKANELRDLDLFEISAVPIPANQHAVVTDVKAGRRNSKADADILDQIREFAQNILDSIDKLNGDNTDDEHADEPSQDKPTAPESDDGSDSGDEGKAAFLEMKKQAILSTLER